MNLRIVVSTLCLGGALVFSAAEASAFGFGCLGGGSDCCEPACGCEPSCCVAEPSCGCEPSCDPCCEPRRCRLLDGLKGLFSRHNGCCEPACGCEPSCCVAEPTCCAPEPSCCVVEPSCGCEADCCDPCCQPRRCRLLDGLKGLFHRHSSCCEPACGCEPSCSVEPTCGC